MPLSEYERKMLEELEAQLADEDPSFADTLKPEPPAASVPMRLSLRHLVLGLLIAVLGIAVLVAVLLWIFMAQSYFDWRTFAVYPRSASGLLGILTAPLLHGSWEHLAANSVAILVLGTLAGSVYPRATARALPIIWLGSGIGAWWWGYPGTFHLGASGLTHGLMFLVFVLAAFALAPVHSQAEWWQWLARPGRRRALAVFFAALLAHMWVGLRDVLVISVERQSAGLAARPAAGLHGGPPRFPMERSRAAVEPVVIDLTEGHAELVERGSAGQRRQVGQHFYFIC